MARQHPVLLLAAVPVAQAAQAGGRAGLCYAPCLKAYLSMLRPLAPAHCSHCSHLSNGACTRYAEALILDVCVLQCPHMHRICAVCTVVVAGCVAKARLPRCCLHLCHMLQVSEFAAAKRVVLKGDLPIGVDKRSVDTWMEVSRQAHVAHIVSRPAWRL